MNNPAIFEFEGPPVVELTHHYNHMTQSNRFSVVVWDGGGTPFQCHFEISDYAYASLSDQSLYLLISEKLIYALPYDSESYVAQSIRQGMAKMFASLSQNPTTDAISWYGPTHAASHITDDSVSEASKNLPGVDQIVMCPCSLPKFEQGKAGHWCRWKTSGGKIWSIVQHLNDVAGWSRESIADWLDDLHDRGIVNIEFQPWNEGENNE